MACLALCTVAMVVACRDREQLPERDQDIVIGVIAPVGSGFFRSGLPTVEGARLAISEINATGGVDLGSTRRKIRLVVEDSEDRPETAVSKAFKLIDSDGAVALVGLTVSNIALAVARVAQERRVPMISTSSSNPEMTWGRSFVFRTIFDDSFQGQLMAEFAAGDLGARQASIISDPSSAYSQGCAQVFQEVFEQLGGEIGVHESYIADDRDFKGRLLRIRQSGADLLVVPIYPALLKSLMPRVRAAGITALALGGDSWGGVGVAERGGWAPAFFSDAWAPEVKSPESIRFVEVYRQAHGKVATTYAALAYDAVSMLAAAIEHQADAAPESIRVGLLSLESFTGVTGKIRYQGTGDPVRSAVVMQLAADGSARLHQSLEP